MTHRRNTVVCRRNLRSFTLVELLTAMGVMLVLAAITLVAVKSISRSTRVSSGINTVTAALSNARALAMKNGRPVLVAFMVNWDPSQPDIPQTTRLIIAEWSRPCCTWNRKTPPAETTARGRSAPPRQRPPAYP